MPATEEYSPRLGDGNTAQQSGLCTCGHDRSAHTDEGGCEALPQMLCDCATYCAICPSCPSRKMFRLLVGKSDDGYVVTPIDPSGALFVTGEVIWRRHRVRAVRVAIDAILDKIGAGIGAGVGFIIDDVEVPS